MKTGTTITLFFFIVSALQVHAQSELPQREEMDRIIQKANELYKQRQYQQAEAVYNEVLEKESSNHIAKYNRAIALYKQGKKGEAIKEFDDLAFKTEERELKSKAYYNKGSILSGQVKLEESIEAYKNALRQNPNEKQARENLQKALLELKKKTPPKKDNKKKQQQKQQQKPQPKMNPKEAEQRLKLLEQKEKEVQQRMQKEKSKTGGGQPKDW
ncbi:MAG: tetratricopeptide repeat protein [Chitinophagaceae bacterium]